MKRVFLPGKQWEKTVNGRCSVEPVLLHCSPAPSLCFCRRWRCCCFQILFVSRCLCMFTWADSLGFLVLFLCFKCLFCSWDLIFWRALIKAHYIAALRTLVGAFCCRCLEATKAHQKRFPSCTGQNISGSLWCYVFKEIRGIIMMLESNLSIFIALSLRLLRSMLRLE